MGRFLLRVSEIAVSWPQPRRWAPPGWPRALHQQEPNTQRVEDPLPPAEGCSLVPGRIQGLSVTARRSKAFDFERDFCHTELLESRAFLGLSTGQAEIGQKEAESGALGAGNLPGSS